MSQEAVLWLLGGLLAALYGLIGFLAKIFWAKLNELDSGALAAFVARFDATERSWDIWRTTFVVDTAYRRDAIDKRLDAHAALIHNHGDRVTRIERNGH